MDEGDANVGPKWSVSVSSLISCLLSLCTNVKYIFSSVWIVWIQIIWVLRRWRYKTKIFISIWIFRCQHSTRYIHKNWRNTQTLFYGSGGCCVFWCCFDILPPPPVYGKYDNLSSALNVVTDLLQFSKRKIDVVSWQNCHVCHVSGPQHAPILSLITAPFMMFRWSSPRKLCHLL